MKRSLLRRAALAAMVLIALAAASWQVLQAPAEETEGTLPLRTAAVVRGSIVQTISATGLLQPRVRVDVGTQVGGQVNNVHVTVGQTVRKGDLLVSLDPDVANNELAQAEAQLVQQQAVVDATRIELGTAQREDDRQQRLMAEDATQPSDAERATADRARISAQLRGQEAALSRAKVAVDKARLASGRTRVTSPIDGVVVSLPVEMGQTLNPTTSIPVVASVAELQRLTVRVRVPEADIGSVRAGQHASFVPLASEDRRYAGKVRVVLPLAERVGSVVFYNVLFEVDNPDRQLFADMTVKVHIEVSRANDTLMVPVAAVGERVPDGRYVVTVSDKSNRLADRLVQLAARDAHNAQVLSGLEAGEHVVIDRSKLHRTPGPSSAAGRQTASTQSHASFKEGSSPWL